MQKIAILQGGKCLSNQYLNNWTKLLWECKRGHRWEAVPKEVKNNNTWCPFCSKRAPKTIEDMRAIAKERGGKCLSNTYINSHTKLLWECTEGHRWEAPYGNIQQGHWCGKCSGTSKKSLSDMHELAKSKGGFCISDTYIDMLTPLLWQCSNGHKWKAKPNSIQQGSWCPECAGNTQNKIEDMQVIARERGGVCLSSEYANNNTPLLWECSVGHRWSASPKSIVRGSWCSYCSTGLGERICRVFFEQIFDSEFPQSYPKWLINDKNNRMELDGYSNSLKIAFEHHGRQHYSLETHFIINEETLEKRKRDDRLKRVLCEKQGIRLIEIPEVPAMLSVSGLKEFIKNECIKKGITLPKDFDQKQVNANRAYTTPISVDKINRLKDIAHKNKGRCLSDNYVDDGTKLLWECKERHQWLAVPGTILRGHWCPNCAGMAKKSIQDAMLVAKDRGGKCLSEVYTNTREKLLSECAQGHKWKATYGNVSQSSWCPYCSGMAKKSIEDMRSLAKKYGGKCLSDEYVDNKSVLFWECACGFQWLAKPNSIQQGSWCPRCAGNLKKTTEDMKALASKRGGKCLSETYINSQTKLLWECSEGHQWEALLNTIQRGSWCPECAGINPHDIGMMHSTAIKRGGECLSVQYVNSRTKLLWKCSMGHQWEAIPEIIIRGHWCPKCAGNLMKTIGDMRILASKRGGKCLSETYINSQTKLLWECSQGHRWQAKPNKIQQRSWCPTCWKNRRKKF